VWQLHDVQLLLLLLIITVIIIIQMSFKSKLYYIILNTIPIYTACQWQEGWGVKTTNTVNKHYILAIILDSVGRKCSGTICCCSFCPHWLASRDEQPNSNSSVTQSPGQMPRDRSLGFTDFTGTFILMKCHLKWLAS